MTSLQGSLSIKEMEEILKRKKQKTDQSSSSTMITSPNSDLLNCINSAAASSAINMFSPQFLANQTAAAVALMTWPIQLRAQLASAIRLPNHSPLFGGWPTSPPLSSSPVSPALSQKSNKSTKLNNHYTNDTQIVSTTSDLVPQRKAPKRKQQPETIKRLDPIKSEQFTSMAVGLLSPNESNSDVSAYSVTAKDPTKDKVFTCKICNRSFGYKHVLQNHERTHTGEKPFECPECHKRFTRDHHLKTHMRLHTGEKPYSCSHCDRQFVQVANLRRHLRVHTGERPYTCEICESRFSDSNQLKAHTLIHNGEKPFECEKCLAKFRRRHHLLHHKCGLPGQIPSPGSPSLHDQSSNLSEESVNLTKTQMNLQQCHQLLGNIRNLSQNSLPLNLSNAIDKRSNLLEVLKHSQSLKTTNLQHLLKLPIPAPEQTEPEDLSMHSPRSAASLEEFEDIDDAASLFIRTRHRNDFQKKLFDGTNSLR